MTGFTLASLACGLAPDVVFLASALLIIPLIQGRELGWAAWTYAMMAAAVVLLVLFVISERRPAERAGTPCQAACLRRVRSVSGRASMVVA